MPVPFVGALYGQIMYGDAGDPDGWSEGYWINGTNYEEALRVLERAIYPARRALMAQDIRAVGFRVSNTAIIGDAMVSKPAPNDKVPPTFNLKASSDSESLPNGCVIFARFETANLRVRSIRPLHAVPASVVSLVTPFSANRSVTGADSSAYKSLFDKFVQVMIAECGVVARVPAPNPLTYGGTIPAAGGTVITAMSGITDIEPGMRVISGSFIPSGARVVSITSAPNTVTIDRPTTIPSAIAASIIFQKAATGAYGFNAFTDGQLDNQVRYRKTGRPFFLLRGRRRA